MEKQLKPKVHAVVVEGRTVLVMARTKQGAITAVIEDRIAKMRDGATVTIATGEQLYHAGMNGESVLHGDQFGPTTAAPAQIDAFAEVDATSTFCPVAAEHDGAGANDVDAALPDHPAFVDGKPFGEEWLKGAAPPELAGS